MDRRISRRIHVGRVPIGGGAPIVVQSMTNTDTRDVSATVGQIEKLAEAGCEIVRLAVPDKAAAASFGEIRKRVDIPLIADIHFDHRLALSALDSGADGLRINPGNIGGPGAVRKVADAAGQSNTPIRIGVNSGSVQKEVLEKYGRPSPEAMVESALIYSSMLEDMGFDLIKISLKSSHVLDTIRAYELLSKKVDYQIGRAHV